MRPNAAPSLSPRVMLDGRYRLEREIASGAMGSVWEALDVTTGTLVALKVLRPELDSDPSIRRRFRREASVLQSISHPSLVRVLDLGTDEPSERAYTVMELLRGETLEARLVRERALTPAQLVPILRAICEGLAAVHAHGVIHGDLKPANIFLERGGKTAATIVDFGLSKVEGLERLTRTGELTGTPAYMAPELLTGAPELDARLDQYALGVVMHQSLAGDLPFATRKHPGALMMEIVSGRGVPLDVAAPHLPSEVHAVVARAMATRPDARFPDVLALADAFDAAART